MSALRLKIIENIDPFAGRGGYGPMLAAGAHAWTRLRDIMDMSM